MLLLLTHIFQCDITFFGSKRKLQKWTKKNQKKKKLKKKIIINVLYVVYFKCVWYGKSHNYGKTSDYLLSKSNTLPRKTQPNTHTRTQVLKLVRNIRNKIARQRNKQTTAGQRASQFKSMTLTLHWTKRVDDGVISLSTIEIYCKLSV